MISALRRFGRDRRGNFALAAAILSVPVVMGVGLAVDLSTVERSRSALQQALDSAALAVAREGVTLSDAAAFDIADNFMKGNFAGTYSNLRVSRDGTAVTVTADAMSETSFGGVLGYKNWTVSGLSTADFALTPYEIALVLDTTGSMAGGKLAAMKEAVIGLVDTMSANVQDKKNLKFAMVPFSSFVNVGPQFGPKFDGKGKILKGSGADWLDIQGTSAVAQVELRKGVSRFEVFHNLGEEWAGCVETREPTSKVAYDVTDAAPGKKAESLFVPAISIDEPDTADYRNSYIVSDVDPLDTSLGGAVKKLKKYGLIGNIEGLLSTAGSSDDSSNSGTGSSSSGSSGSDNDGVEWLPVATSSSGGKGPNASCTTRPITPLSTQYQQLKNDVLDLQASGNTNIMEGVAWGWRVLSPGAPFTEGSTKKAGARKIMIVLTDGSNVMGVRGTKLGSTYSSFGFAVDARLLPGGSSEGAANAAMNAKTLTACSNAKDDGLEIFTIRLEEPDKKTGMMLKDCATDSDHFFDAPSRSQLDEVFGKIRDKITSVRITS